MLTGSSPEKFGDLSFATVTHLLKCPSAFLGKDGECAALLVYGVLLGGILSSVGDVVVDLLPWPETVFLIRAVAADATP